MPMNTTSGSWIGIMPKERLDNAGGVCYNGFKWLR